ncbi:MAG: mechanosensitive ion channel [Spirochaetes bacterium]|nr:mechanosensitive ion channel [Spirochaetota bacterium]
MIDIFIESVLQFLRIEDESLAGTIVHMVFKFVIPLAVLIAAYKAIMLGIYRIIAKRRLSSNKKVKIVFWLRIVFRIIFIILLVFIVKILFGENSINHIKILFSGINQPLFSTGNSTISLFTMIMIIPVFYFSTWAGKVVYRLVDTSFFSSTLTSSAKQAEHEKNVYLGNLSMFVEPSNKKVLAIAKILKYVVVVFAFIIGLSLIGIDISSIAVLLGVLGIGLGFGLQNLIANIFAGFTIMLTKPIEEGDFINVRGSRGTVVKVNSVSTIVLTRLNETIIVPNSVLLSDVIYNDSHSDRIVVIENMVIVSYDSDVEMIKTLLIEIAKRSPYSKKNDEPDARITNFDRAGVEFTLYSAINEVVERGPARAWIYLEIWREFKKNGIKIPVSQMDVNIKKEERNELYNSGL